MSAFDGRVRAGTAVRGLGTGLKLDRKTRPLTLRNRRDVVDSWFDEERWE